MEEYEEGPITRETIVFPRAMISKLEVAHLIGKKEPTLCKIGGFCRVSLTHNDRETEVKFLMQGPLQAYVFAQFVQEHFIPVSTLIVDSLSSLDFPLASILV